MTYKGFWKSKTFWFNALAGVVMVANALGYADFAPDAQWIGLVAALINIGLRFAVTQPVTTDRSKVGTRAG